MVGVLGLVYGCPVGNDTGMISIAFGKFFLALLYTWFTAFHYASVTTFSIDMPTVSRATLLFKCNIRWKRTEVDASASILFNLKGTDCFIVAHLLSFQ